MAGLLDITEDPQTMGLLSLGLRLMSTPGKFGPALGQSGLGALGDLQQMQQRKKQAEMQALQKQLLGAQIKETEVQAAQRQAQTEKAALDAAEQLRQRNMLTSLFAPTRPINANAVSGVTGPRPAALAAVGTRPPVDYQALIAAGIPAEVVQKLAEARNYGRDEVKYQEERGEDGKPVLVPRTKYGDIQGKPTPKAYEMKIEDLGGMKKVLDPYGLKAGMSFDKTMTQSEKDASSRGWAGIGIQRQTEARQAAKDALPEFNADAGGFVDRKRQTVTPLPGGAAAKPMTEGQAKALNFASRMERSDKIINTLYAEGKAYSTPGSRAGFGIGNVVTALNTEAGQKLDQAKRDFLNAVLRRESGAVISESEFDSGEKSYFPQIGEGEAVIRQKAEARRTAIEGIKADIPKGHMPAYDRIVNPPKAPMPKINTSAGVPQIKFLGFE